MSSSSAETRWYAESRDLVKDLFRPNPIIYWVDFLVSLTIGAISSAAYVEAPIFSLTQLAYLLIAACSLYRSASFMHEIVHFKKREMRSFKVAWNLLAGIPLMIPSFLYEPHVAHHSSRQYGTQQDSEYLPLGGGRWRVITEYLLQVFVLPVAGFLRFFLITPLSFVCPPLRRWALEHATTNMINFRYRREIPENAPRKLWALIELGCFLRSTLLFILPIALPLLIPGERPAEWRRVPEIYMLAVTILSINHLRTLVAHRYRGRGETMSHEDQFFDSVDIVGDPVFTELLCPVGMRYHALHHLFPSLPYHNLGTAHRRLMAKLPADSPYRKAVVPSFWTALANFIRHTRVAAKENPSSADEWLARPIPTGDDSDETASSKSPRKEVVATHE